MNLREFSQKYLNVLRGTYSSLNLTRILSDEDFYQKQILDSLLPLEHSREFSRKINSSKVLIDIGFGGGFPLLPMALMVPDLKFIGIEARAKKAAAVQEIAAILGLNNVKTLHGRIEEFEIDLPSVVTFKAVGECYKCLSWVKPTCKDVVVYFYKGPNYKSELDGEPPAGWSLVSEESLEKNELMERHFLGFRYDGVPRGTNKSKINLVKVSQILKNF